VLVNSRTALGRAVAGHARDAGHDVTCAARGISGTVPDGVRLVKVDRDEPDDLSPLAGRRSSVFAAARDRGDDEATTR
jgi:hypothetical protein